MVRMGGSRGRGGGRWEHLPSPAHLSPPLPQSRFCSTTWRNGFPPGWVIRPPGGSSLAPPCTAGRVPQGLPQCCVGVSTLTCEPGTEAGLGEGCSEHVGPRRGQLSLFTVSLKPRRCLPRSGPSFLPRLLAPSHAGLLKPEDEARHLGSVPSEPSSQNPR